MEVERGQVFAIGLRQPVVAVRPARGVRIHLLALGVETGDMVGAGEYHALDPVLAGGFVDMEGADDVGLQDLFEGVFGGNPAQVHDGIHVLGQCQYAGLVCQVAGDDFLMLACGSCHRADVRCAHDVGVYVQGFA
ncbi:hypothetical protein D3C79_783680 [compost metagenome]